MECTIMDDPNASRSSSSGLKDLLSEEAPYPIVSCIISHLNLAEIHYLQSVCRSFRWLAEQVRKSRLNVKLSLAKFVRDPASLLGHLKRSGGLISKGFALDFFVPGPQLPTHIDLFIRNGRPLASCLEWLVLHEQYVLRDMGAGGGDETPMSYIYDNKKRGTSIRITETETSPLQAVLRSACTTADLNLITWNKAYSLFPYSTIAKHEFFPIRPLDDEFGETLVQYAELGWTTRDIIWPDIASQRPRGMGTRRVGDQFSLIVPINSTSGTPETAFDYAVEYSQFEIASRTVSTVSTNAFGGRQGYGFGPPPSFRTAEGEAVMFALRSETFTSPALRHEYTFVRSSWKDFAMKLLNRWALLELYKLDPVVRPALPPRGPPHKFEINLPDDFIMENQPSWDFADDQMAVWYRQWEAGHQR